ncbi:hypothetical protein V6N13_124028 [Hibiscus sabdariffa]
MWLKSSPRLAREAMRLPRSYPGVANFPVFYVHYGTVVLSVCQFVCPILSSSSFLVSASVEVSLQLEAASSFEMVVIYFPFNPSVPPCFPPGALPMFTHLLRDLVLSNSTLILRNSPHLPSPSRMSIATNLPIMFPILVTSCFDIMQIEISKILTQF